MSEPLDITIQIINSNLYEKNYITLWDYEKRDTPPPIGMFIFTLNGYSYYNLLEQMANTTLWFRSVDFMYETIDQMKKSIKDADDEVLKEYALCLYRREPMSNDLVVHTKFKERQSISRKWKFIVMPNETFVITMRGVEFGVLT